jgi:hypothetical protein
MHLAEMYKTVTVIKYQCSVFWDRTLFNPLNANLHSEGKNRLHLLLDSCLA